MDVRKVKKSWIILSYVLIFSISFAFFAYLTFPYGVLKEALTARISKAVGISIRIDEFGPSLPLGFDATNVRIQAGSGPTVIFKEVELTVSILRLLIGQLGINIHLIDPQNGILNIDANFSIPRLLEQNLIPKYVALDAKSFGLGSIVSFLTNRMAQAPDTNPLIAPMLNKVGLKGALAGTASFELDPTNLPQSTGSLKLDVQNATLNIDDPALELGEQKFEKAAIIAAIKDGVFDLASTSGFHTQGMTLDLQGTVKLKAEMGKSQLDLGISLKLENALKDQFGFLLDMAGGADGALKFQVRGTLDQPSMGTI